MGAVRLQPSEALARGWSNRFQASPVPLDVLLCQRPPRLHSLSKATVGMHGQCSGRSRPSAEAASRLPSCAADAAIAASSESLNPGWRVDLNVHRFVFVGREFGN